MVRKERWEGKHDGSKHIMSAQYHTFKLNGLRVLHLNDEIECLVYVVQGEEVKVLRVVS